MNQFNPDGSKSDITFSGDNGLAGYGNSFLYSSFNHRNIRIYARLALDLSNAAKRGKQ